MMMRAKVHLIYKDRFEACFDFCDNGPQERANDILQTVCRGCLMASAAIKVVAYDEEGAELCSYEKSMEFEFTKKMFRG